MRRPSNRRDRGQSLLLLPAGFLIVLLLGSLVLEAAALHLRQRQLDDLADSLASDAAAVGFDHDEYRRSGSVAIDPDQARSVVGPGIAISLLPDARPDGLQVIGGAEPRIEVVLSFDHEYIIGRSLLGGSPKTLTAVGRADLVLSVP
jgi:hypothetical protein